MGEDATLELEEDGRDDRGCKMILDLGDKFISYLWKERSKRDGRQ